MGATCRLPKIGTVAETSPLPLSLPSPQELNSKDLLLLLPPLPSPLHAWVVLLEAVVPQAHPCRSASLCALNHSPLPQLPFFFQI